MTTREALALPGRGRIQYSPYVYSLLYMSRSLRKLRELSSRPSSSRATERRGHHAERARAHLLCRYVPKLNSHRVRVFVALSAVARVTDLARVVRLFFFSSLVDALSKFEREGTFHAFTASARAGTDASRVARVRRGSGPCPRRGARRRAALSFSIRMVTNSFLLCKNTAVLYESTRQSSNYAAKDLL